MQQNPKESTETPSNSYVSLLKWSYDHLKISSKPNNQMVVPLIIWLEKRISHRQGKVKKIHKDKVKNYDKRKTHSERNDWHNHE